MYSSSTSTYNIYTTYNTQQLHLTRRSTTHNQNLTVVVVAGHDISTVTVWRGRRRARLQLPLPLPPTATARSSSSTLIDATSHTTHTPRKREWSIGEHRKINGCTYDGTIGMYIDTSQVVYIISSFFLLSIVYVRTIIQK